MMIRMLLTMICLCSAPLVRADVVVFAAASLKEPLDRLAGEVGGMIVTYGGSGTLARQVSLGAPADVVLLANEDWMNFLTQGGHVRAKSVTVFASNALVVIGAVDMADLPLSAEGLDAALDGGRIATGLTEAVPAGIYAKAALLSLGLWDHFADKLAEVDNVRSALTLVARGQTPLGIVYATDARVSDAVRIVSRFPAESYPPIRYTAALTPDASADAMWFLAVLNGPQGQAALSAAGFLPVQETAQ